MLNNLLDTIIENLKKMNVFKQIEPYEGQFDDISEFTITPPSCFIEFAGGRPDNALGKKSIINIDMYIVTNHIKGRLNAPMLEIIENIKNEFNDRLLGKLGRCVFLSFERLAIMPGICAYRISFEFKEHL